MKIIEKRPRGRPRLLDREQALEAALQLFWRHGYEGTSIADLTAAMGVTPPSLYAAFSNKEALYSAALDRYEASYGGYAARALADEPRIKDAVARMLREAVTIYSAGREPLGCMLAAGAVMCGPEHKQVIADLARRRGSVTAMIRDRFDRAVAEGELAPSTDTAALAAYYAAVIQGLSIQARDGVDRNVLHAIAAMALSAWPCPAPYQPGAERDRDGEEHCGALPTRGGRHAAGDPDS